MASDIAPKRPEPSPPAAGQKSRPAGEKVIGYGDYIETQIRRTRQQVKWIEISLSAMVLIIGLLIYAMLFALIDHWVVPGGVGRGVRLVFFAGLVLGGGFYTLRYLLPLIVRRVNPLYAAQAVEQTQPSLKNSVINFLMLRGEKEHVHAAVYRALERRAAMDLHGVPLDGAIDRSRVIRAGYVLLAVVAIVCFYTLLSPKNPLRSVGRLMAPWADVAPPTRVSIGDVQPGTVQAFHGDIIDVSAVVQGLASDETVSLVYTTADGQAVERPVTMQLPEGSFRHQIALPPGGSGLKQSMEYFLAAGDARSQTYHIEVVTAPAILVKQIRLDYPAYTGLSSRSIDHQGDIQGIEGTQVQLFAEANEPISTAWIDYASDGRRDVQMQVNERAARGTISLHLNRERSGPEHENYQLLFESTGGEHNRSPIRHRIEVVPDLEPEIRFLSPARDGIEVPSNGYVPLVISAQDRDFQLAAVSLHVTRGSDGEVLLRQPLLSQTQDRFAGEYQLRPSELGLRPGDRVTYWAEARDNKHPTANRSETVKYSLIVTDAVDDPDAVAEQTRQPEADAATDAARDFGKTEPEPDADANQPSDPEAEAVSEPSGAEQSDEDSTNQAADQQRVDPESNPGEAFNKILDHARRQQEEQEKPSEQRGQQESGNQEQGQQQQGQQDSGQQEQGAQSSTSGNDQGDQQEGKQDGQQAGEPPAGEQGQNPPGGEQSSPEQPGESESGSDSTPPAGEQGDNQQPAPGENQQAGEPGEQPPGSEEEAGEGGGAQQDNPGEQPGGADSNEAGGEGQAAGEQAGQQTPPPGAAGQETSGDQGGSKSNSAAEPTAGQRSPADRPSGPAERMPGGPTDDSSSGRTEQGGENQEGGEAPVGDQSSGSGEQQRSGEATEAGETGQPSAGGEEAEVGETPNKQFGSETDEIDQAGSQKEQAGSEGRSAQSGEQQPSARDDAQDRTGEGQGNKTAGDAGAAEQENPRGEGESEQQGGDSDHQKGDPGKGTSTGQEMPSPPQHTPSKKTEKTPGGEQQYYDELSRHDANSPSSSEQESDTEGGESGEQSGGGKEGGGQRASQQGTGAAGNNTAADQGNSQAPGQGTGETSSQRGEQVPSDQGSNNPGEKGRSNSPDAQSRPGEGASGGEQGKSGGGDSAGSGQAGQGNQSSSNPDAASAPGDTSETAQTGRSTAGGRPGEHSAVPPQPDGTPPAGPEAANREYANEATDLALQHLRDQLTRDKVDDQLLKDLNWSREDMEKFLSRWERLKQAAQAPGTEGDKAREELNRALGGLGLRPRGGQVQAGETPQDRSRRLLESQRTRPPREYLELYEEWSKSTSRARDNQ